MTSLWIRQKPVFRFLLRLGQCWVELHYGTVLRDEFYLQSATKWVETLRPKWTFWRFPDFKRGKDSVSSPIPSMQCCATVRATFRKQETSQLWIEGTGEGCGFLCFWSYPIWVQCLNNFVVDCLNHKSGHASLRKLIQFMSSCWDVKPPLAFYLLCLTLSCLFENN